MTGLDAVHFRFGHLRDHRLDGVTGIAFEIVIVHVVGEVVRAPGDATLGDRHHHRFGIDYDFCFFFGIRHLDDGDF